jgi:hypothetical protein
MLDSIGIRDRVGDGSKGGESLGFSKKNLPRKRGGRELGVDGGCAFN